MAETCEGTHDMWRAPAARARLGGTRRPSKVAEVTGWRRVITEYMVFPSLYLKKQVKCQTLLTCFEQEIKGPGKDPKNSIVHSDPKHEALTDLSTCSRAVSLKTCTAEASRASCRRHGSPRHLGAPACLS
ncbi:uncharacterized protein LJ206_007356 isoform 1-T1 [Theristicus caerulescens]